MPATSSRPSSTRLGVVLSALALLLGCGGEIILPSAPEPTDRPDDPGDPPDDPVTPVTEDQCRDVQLDPGPDALRRLTPWEYANLVEDALGIDVGALATAGWPPRVRLHGLSNMAEGQSVTLTHIEAFEALATDVASEVDGADLVRGCDAPGSSACAESVARDLATMFFRRDPTDDEVTRFAAPMLAAVTEHGLTPADGALWTLRALLQSGSFLYRLETHSAGDDPAIGLPANDLAVRLSFLVWGTGPDQALRDAAADGRLDDESGIRAEVQRLLANPRAERQSLAFIADWLGIADLSRSNVVQAYPGLDRALLEELRQETLAVARHILWETDAPIHTLLTTTETIMSGAAAEWYGLESQGEAPATYALPPERAGILTHGAVLARAGGAEQSMITRGLYLLESVLCQELPPPPPGVDRSDDGRGDSNTEREASEVRLGRDTCAPCHSAMEPLAHAFEPFDGAGRHRTENDDGFALRTDSEMLLQTLEELAWTDTRDFLAQIAASDAAQLCLVQRPISFGLGRALSGLSDSCALQEIRRAFDDGGQTYPALIEAIATHPLFRTARPLEDS